MYVAKSSERFDIMDDHLFVHVSRSPSVSWKYSAFKIASKILFLFGNILYQQTLFNPKIVQGKLVIGGMSWRFQDMRL